MDSVILEYVEKSGIDYLQVVLTDIFGAQKGLEFSVRSLRDVDQIGIDGSSVGFEPTKHSDLSLLPDPNTFLVLPWDQRIGRILCDVKKADGQDFDACPRTILKHQIDKLATSGSLQYLCRPELEFYLVDEDCPADEAHYMDLEPWDEFASLRRKMIDVALEIGVPIKYGHHECGPGQIEVEFLYDDPLRAADYTQLFKNLARYLSWDEEGFIATFMPKPFSGEAGNGLHIHQRLLKSEQSIFTNEDGELTDECRYFIGGLIKHAPAMTAITCPTVNSFRRMVAGQEAPVYLTWGVANRTALIRIPGYEKEAKLEYRGGDGAANIYLLLSVLIASGLDGIKRKIEPPEQVTIDIDALSNKERREMGIELLPSNLSEALDALEEDEFMKGVLGADLLEVYLREKRKEWSEFQAIAKGAVDVTEWEFDKYLRYG
ncbi:MAG: glutamine synthetase family protein [Candidatus Hodarchaeota archaeon]